MTKRVPVARLINADAWFIYSIICQNVGIMYNVHSKFHNATGMMYRTCRYPGFAMTWKHCLQLLVFTTDVNIKI